MFRLRDLKNGLFQIHKKDGPAFEGPARPIFEEAIRLGVQENSLAHAVERLCGGEGSYADFDANGKLKKIIIEGRKK